MSISLRPFGELTQEMIADLDRRMAAFYTHPPPNYYQVADRASVQYNEQQQPFHCDLVSRINRGMTVLELGCGSAHLCPFIESRGGVFTGLDYSDELLAENRKRHPKARFLSIAADLPELFDLVASLYTIEHVANPLAYLEKIWNYCRPGGLIGIICPEFIDSSDNAPSIFYGNTPRRFRQKLKSLSLIDAASHLVDVKLRAPAWKRHAQASPPGAFWINLEPQVLCGGEYQIDTDAVHMARRIDLLNFFESKDATIIADSSKMPGIPAHVLKYNCYVLARKAAVTKM
jgi:SAM-dependent methyltransferase